MDQKARRRLAAARIKNWEKIFSWFETRSAPALARCFPLSFAFYLGNPFPRLLAS
jgi:hypothetical protein